LQRKPSHDGGDDHVRPAGPGTEHSYGCKQHCEIAKHVVARANPRRTHVGIAASDAKKALAAAASH
jgi:hypothetical protein